MASNEYAKNQEKMFSTFLVNLLKTRSRYGATAMRAILRTCKNNWLDLDTVFECDNGNSHMINDELSWVFLGERNKGEFEKRLYENLVGKEEHFICCLIQLSSCNASAETNSTCSLTKAPRQ